MSFWEGVNVTLGLPIVRTSPDHGTGFDIAGKGHCRSAQHDRGDQMAAEMADARAGLSLPPLREVIAAHGLTAKKSLGQNFLLDLNLTRRIARAAEAARRRGLRSRPRPRRPDARAAWRKAPRG